MLTDSRRNAVTEELLAIQSLSRVDLLERWMTAYGRLAPKGISRRLLEYGAAYAIQVKAFGGQKPVVRRKLERAVGSKRSARSSNNKAAPKTSLSVGARLIRDWHGRTHTVDVVEGGFCYEAMNYKSLSHIAREITGARWSGPRFFGL